MPHAAAARRRHHAQQGILSKTLTLATRALSWLALALTASIAAEWIGMTFIWEEQGLLHSRRMLAQELAYLNQDFYQSIVTANPTALAKTAARKLHELLFEWTRIAYLTEWLTAPSTPSDSPLRMTLRAIYRPLADYLSAASTITQVFGVRLTVLILAVPVFALLGIVGITDGLVERDLRRWGGGRESAFVYHHVKRLIAPSLMLVWVLYLAMPISIHPGYFILPFAVLFGIAMATTVAAFKKYL